MPRIIATKKEDPSDSIEIEHEKEENDDIYDRLKASYESCHNHAELGHTAEHLSESHKSNESQEGHLPPPKGEEGHGEQDNGEIEAIPVPRRADEVTNGV